MVIQAVTWHPRIARDLWRAGGPWKGRMERPRFRDAGSHARNPPPRPARRWPRKHILKLTWMQWETNGNCPPLGAARNCCRNLCRCIRSVTAFRRFLRRACCTPWLLMGRSTTNLRFSLITTMLLFTCGTSARFAPMQLLPLCTFGSTGLCSIQQVRIWWSALLIQCERDENGWIARVIGGGVAFGAICVSGISPSRWILGFEWSTPNAWQLQQRMGTQEDDRYCHDMDSKIQSSWGSHLWTNAFRTSSGLATLVWQQRLCFARGCRRCDGLEENSGFFVSFATNWRMTLAVSQWRQKQGTRGFADQCLTALGW